MVNFTLPNHHRLPTFDLQFRKINLVPRDIPGKLFFPEGPSRFRNVIPVLDGKDVHAKELPVDLRLSNSLKPTRAGRS